jgi:hypothetical protein
MQLSEELLRGLGWEGHAMVEYRFDEARNRYVLMEVNGHLWGSLALSSACGAEFAWEAYRRRVLGDTEDAPPPRAGLAARDLIKETRRLRRVFGARRGEDDPNFVATPWLDLRRYLLGFIDPGTRPYVFSWRDPLPAFWSLGATLTRTVRPANSALGASRKAPKPVA